MLFTIMISYKSVEDSPSKECCPFIQIICHKDTKVRYKQQLIIDNTKDKSDLNLQMTETNMWGCNKDYFPCIIMNDKLYFSVITIENNKCSLEIMC